MATVDPVDALRKWYENLSLGWYGMSQPPALPPPVVWSLLSGRNADGIVVSTFAEQAMLEMTKRVRSPDYICEMNGHLSLRRGSPEMGSARHRRRLERKATAEKRHALLEKISQVECDIADLQRELAAKEDQRSRFEERSHVTERKTCLVDAFNISIDKQSMLIKSIITNIDSTTASEAEKVRQNTERMGRLVEADDSRQLQPEVDRTCYRILKHIENVNKNIVNENLPYNALHCPEEALCLRPEDVIQCCTRLMRQEVESLNGRIESINLVEDTNAVFQDRPFAVCQSVSSLLMDQMETHAELFIEAERLNNEIAQTCEKIDAITIEPIHPCFLQADAAAVHSVAEALEEEVTFLRNRNTPKLDLQCEVEELQRRVGSFEIEKSSQQQRLMHLSSLSSTAKANLHRICHNFSTNVHNLENRINRLVDASFQARKASSTGLLSFGSMPWTSLDRLGGSGQRICDLVMYRGCHGASRGALSPMRQALGISQYASVLAVCERASLYCCELNSAKLCDATCQSLLQHSNHVLSLENRARKAVEDDHNALALQPRLLDAIEASTDMATFGMGLCRMISQAIIDYRDHPVQSIISTLFPLNTVDQKTWEQWDKLVRQYKKKLIRRK